MGFVRLLLLALAAVVIGAAAYGYSVMRRGFSTRTQPSSLEAVVARTVRSMAIPRDAREKRNPWAERATPEVLAAARAHWADHCALCHANDGSGNTEIGENLYPKATDMRLPATQDLADGELYYIIRNGVPLTGMPAWGDPSLEQDDESWQLVSFIRHLPNITPQELQEMERMNPKSEAQRAEERAVEEFLGTGEWPEEPAEGQLHH